MSMATVKMSSKWGVQLEGEAVDLVNLRQKVNHSIAHPESCFISMFGPVHVLRSAAWDRAGTDEAAFQLALGDLALLRGCLDVLDGCGDIGLGTIYRFMPDQRYEMTRLTTLPIRVLKDPSKAATPQDFGALLAKVDSDRCLRQAFSDLHSDASWIDLYRCWESLKDHWGGEAKVYKVFRGEEARIGLMKRTANSYRHVKTYDVIDKPMPRAEAVAYLKDLLQRSAIKRGAPPASKETFVFGTQVELTDHILPAGQPASLERLTMTPVGTGAADLVTQSSVQGSGAGEGVLTVVSQSAEPQDP